MFYRFLLLPLLAGSLFAEDDRQAVLLSGRRMVEALEVLGRPLSAEAASKLAKVDSVESLAEILDPLCLVEVTINPESRVKVVAGRAKSELVEGGWTSFLVKINNEAGVTAPLEVSSPQALPVANAPQKEVVDRWLELSVFRGRPLAPTLSGASVDYRIVQCYARDAGRRAAILHVDVGQGTQDLGFRSEALVNFNCLPTSKLTFRVFDENGKATTAGFEIRDTAGRVYPSQAKRLAPDFHFHPQIYRSSGESIKLPPGDYEVRCSRGPEYQGTRRRIVVGDSASEIEFRLKRWIDPASRGWWSGDHHIHAAGCSHYSNPTQGVHASDMMRHCLGEDLKVGSNLTWGPCFDYQKQFFTGKDDKVSQYPYILRYDIEVSGFGSHQSGHLCLLRLKQQMFPGGESKHHWPTLCLNTLRWAKRQGAVVGPAHSGWGLATKSDELPNFEIPPFDGIGANEYIVDVTHMVTGPAGESVPAVDFISTVDTPIHWELNIWYHTLYVGYRTRISGETDFPCIYGERVGLGRSYVKLDGDLSYNKWCQGIRLGRNYTGDGRSHLMDFTVGGVEVGTRNSEVKLAEPGAVPVALDVAALLAEKPERAIRDRPLTHKPYWHIERARVGDSREVEIELLLNGWPVQRKRVMADGSTKRLEFSLKVDRSSWVAARVFGSSHTNPIWVIVGDAPVRASRRSAKWCLDSVEQCWKQKQRFIAKGEMEDAIAAYAHAREAYRKRLDESLFE